MYRNASHIIILIQKCKEHLYIINGLFKDNVP